MIKMSRRHFLAAACAAGTLSLMSKNFARATGSPVQFDFSGTLDGWQIETGQWAIENVADAATGRALVQRATNNPFNVIVAPGGPYTDVDVSVRFKPISGREDASGGIVFRFAAGRYYVIRANALEDNLTFYYYDQGRSEIASERVAPPALGRWHGLRVTAKGDRIRGWLDGQALIDHRDQRFSAGKIGLWTKADSVTAFDSLIVRPDPAE
jgi:hypothetical protein